MSAAADQVAVESVTQVVVLIGGYAHGKVVDVHRSASRITVTTPATNLDGGFDSAVYTARRLWLGQEPRYLFVLDGLSTEAGFDLLMERAKA